MASIKISFPEEILIRYQARKLLAKASLETGAISRNNQSLYNGFINECSSKNFEISIETTSEVEEQVKDLLKQYEQELKG